MSIEVNDNWQVVDEMNSNLNEEFDGFNNITMEISNPFNMKFVFSFAQTNLLKN